MTSPREQIAAQAMAWIGTPYHHHARVLGAGVDCAQLVAAVCEAAGIVGPQDLGNYAPQWWQHRSEELYLQGLINAGAQVAEVPRLGDVGVWRFGRTFSHGGIVVTDESDPVIVHAFQGAGRVIASRPSEAPLAGRDVTWWRVTP